MSLRSFNESINKARKINEDAAAAVAELTKEMKPKIVSFTFPADGILLGQLEMTLKKGVSPSVEVTSTGTSITVVTDNEAACTKVLKTFGVNASVDGAVSSTQDTDPLKVETTV